jgi:type IV pilus assembly protein PilB
MNETPLGVLLLRHNIITPQQLEHALQEQEGTPEMPLGQILCHHGVLKPNVLAELLDTLGKRRLLGRVLVDRKILTPERLVQALLASRKAGISLGRTLVDNRLITEEDLVQALAEQHDLDVVALGQHPPQRDVAKLISLSYARENHLVPLKIDGKVLTVAVAFPHRRHQLSQLEDCTGMRVKLAIAKESEIMQAQGTLYAGQTTILSKNQDSPGFEISEDAGRESERSKYVAEAIGADVDQLVKKIISLGIRRRASDIHFESAETGMTVRFRIDGLLQECDLSGDAGLIRTHGRQIVSKIKVLCDMDIAERRRPQDSSFKMVVKKEDWSRTVDFRVSTVPNNFGESAVIRVLDKRGDAITLESLGYRPQQTEKLHRILERKTGIFLVTGPTGSGKSSTLYALLSRINTPDSKTLTVEDPIEYTIAGITQTEVNEVIGNTFARLLRAFLRQDPDNIMVGEIRDVETATIAIRAAMTGHTVLSTLHTNDATSAVTRLIDIGVEPNLLATTLRCVLAQRLVRRNCPHCLSDYEPSAALLRDFGLDQADSVPYRRGTGCSHCDFTGYAGRLPITEIWVPTREELLLINRRPDNVTLRNEVFASDDRISLVEDGLNRVFEGETTLEEIVRVVPSEQIDAAHNHARDTYTAADTAPVPAIEPRRAMAH